MQIIDADLVGKPTKHAKEVDLNQLQQQLSILTEQVAQNHKILLSLRRSQRVASVISAIKFLILLIPLLLAVKYLPTLLEQVSMMWEQLQVINQGLGGNSTLPALDFNALRELLGQ